MMIPTANKHSVINNKKWSTSPRPEGVFRVSRRVFAIRFLTGIEPDRLDEGTIASSRSENIGSAVGAARIGLSKLLPL